MEEAELARQGETRKTAQKLTCKLQSGAIDLDGKERNSGAVLVSSVTFQRRAHIYNMPLNFGIPSSQIWMETNILSLWSKACGFLPGVSCLPGLEGPAGEFSVLGTAAAAGTGS